MAGLRECQHAKKIEGSDRVELTSNMAVRRQPGGSGLTMIWCITYKEEDQ